MTEDNNKFNAIPISKLRIKILTLLTLFLSSCQSYPVGSSKNAINQASTSGNTNIQNQLTTVNDKKITTPIQPTEDQDEKIIKEIIKNSPDFFPGDLHDDTSESQATVPNNGGVVFATVPNNGGVVFVADPEGSFATKALMDRITQQTLQKIKDKVKNRIVNRVLPKILKKTIGEPKKDVQIKFSNNKTRAEVVIKVTYQRQVLNRLSLKLLKNIKEESVIKSVFIKDSSGWKLNDISPIDTQPLEEKGKIRLEAVKITITPKNENEPVRIIDVSLQELKNKNSLITISRGDIVTFEVKASESNLDAFVKLSNNKLRIPLYDDGSNNNISETEDNPQISGDANQDDNIYTGNITVKSKVGVNYLTLDIIRSGSDESNADNFASISKSIPFIIN